MLQENKASMIIVIILPFYQRVYGCAEISDACAVFGRGVVQFLSVCWQVAPLQQRDALFCLQENGTVTMRVRRRWERVVGSPATHPQHSAFNRDTNIIYNANNNNNIPD